MDALEFEALRQMLARHTSFTAGRTLAVSLEPTADLPEARRLLRETAEALRLPELRPALHLGGVHDVSVAGERARVGGVLPPDALLEIASTVRAARTWRKALTQLVDELPTLAEIAYVQLHDHSGLVETIQDAIAETGEILDDASPALARIRSELRGAHDRLVHRLRELMASPPFRDAVQDPVVTQRSGRYVIPIRSDARGQVQAIVHDQSASGATLFVEPLAAVEMGNRWRTLQAEEAHEVERILRGLSHEVGEQSTELRETVAGLARLDLAQAKARLAGDLHATQPDLVALPRRAGEPVLRLHRARHPLLAGDVVPISLELGGTFDILLITGPNTGGKTVTLKTAGLLVLMAQAGLFVPADEGSVVGAFQHVQADIGDEQSIQQSLSTFSAHVRRIVQMLANADSRCLILLDELGAGTDPQEGAALARALLRYLQERGAYVVATTHYPELKAYAHVTPRVENASVEFDLATLSPTYRLQIGMPGRSNALAIARRLGMPAPILDQAEANLAPRAAEVEALLTQIAGERAEAEAAGTRAEQAAKEAEALRAAAQRALAAAEGEREAAWEQARAEAEEALRDLRREALRLRQELGRRGPDTRRAVDEALRLQTPHPPPVVSSASAAALARDLASGPPALHVGARVSVPQLSLAGRILSIRDGTAELDVLGRRVRMPIADLLASGTRPVPEEPDPHPVERPADRVQPSARVDVPLQLDLRGLRRADALDRLDAYLQAASIGGLPYARIVHGKGTGAVRQAVREALRSSPVVSRFEPEPDAAGGDGATAVWFTP